MSDNKQNTKEWEELTFQEKLDVIYTHKFRPMLVGKNEQYGDAALNPTDFLATDPRSYDIIRSRLNEKLNRLQSLSSQVLNPEAEATNLDHFAALDDTLMDITGYWFLSEIETMRLKIKAVQDLKKSQDEIQ